LIRKGTIAQSKTRWAINKELIDLEVPTNEIDLNTGLSIKKKIGITEENLKVGKTTYAMKAIPDEYIKLESLLSIEQEEVV